MPRQNTWTNSDGLIVGFGRHTSDNNVAGEVDTRGLHKQAVMRITLADLVDTFANVNVDPQAPVIRRGSFITSAYLNTIVAAVSGGGGTLDIGLWGVNIDTPVVDDADGIVADVTVGEMNAVGELHICDGDLVAASGNTAATGIDSVGATSNSDVVIAPSYETAVFTAGVVELYIEWIEPQYSASLAN